MSEQHQFKEGQRVRIDEEEDPPIHVGKMGVIQQLQIGENAEPTCELRIDRIPELISFPQRFLVGLGQ